MGLAMTVFGLLKSQKHVERESGVPDFQRVHMGAGPHYLCSSLGR